MSASSFLRSSAALLSMGVLSSVGQAQVLTADTITGIPLDDGALLSDGVALTQTFTGADRMDLVTFRFVALDGNVPFILATNVSFLLTEWSVDHAEGLPIASAVFSVPSGASWTDGSGLLSYFESTLDFSGIGLDANLTYGISLFGDATTANLALGYLTSADALYASGTGFYNGTAGTVFSPSLGSGNTALDTDFSFAAIDASSSPVPEASSAAVLFAGMFVGGLMVRRRRRQSADAVVALPVAQA